MVTQYQSCDALNAPVVDPNHVTLGMLEVVNPKNSHLVIRSVTDSTLYGASHPILSHLSGEVLPGCVDIRSAPPMYLYGSKFSLSYAGSTRTADLFVDQARSSNCVRSNGSGYNGAACATEDSPGVSGIDCSGYISLALMNAGYRFSVGSRADHYSTSQIVNSLRDRRTSCFEIVPLNEAPIVQPGSIYVMANKHVVMIDSTGPDPLGIDKLPAGTPCDGLSAADFDFRIIHSSSRGSAAGITRMEASDYFVEAAEFAGPLVLMAQNACRVARGESIATQNPVASVGDARLIRRPTPERRGCIGPVSERVHLANESCTSTCDLSVEAPRP